MHLLLTLLLTQAPAPGQNQAAPSADELVKKLDSTAGLKDKPKPFEIATSLGRLYFGQGRYVDALTYYRQALNAADAARALYLVERKAAGTKSADVSALGCTPGPEATVQAMLSKAQGLASLKKHAEAAGCLAIAMAAVKETEVMAGNAAFLSGAAKEAIEQYSRSLADFEDNAEARYARGAVTLDLAGDDLTTLNAAKADLERFVNDAPKSAHLATAKKLLARAEQAIAAGGFSKAPVTPELTAAAAPPRPAGQPPMLTPEVMAAFQNAERTPEMEANFKKLIDTAEASLVEGRFQDALDAYKQVMPYQPDNARLRAGMAWTMVKLNRQPMADNVWRAASQSPEAIDALGDMLKARGAEGDAKAVWARLRDTVPAYAPKLEGKL